MYDVVLRNGLIVDGSGAPPFVGDVAMVGERIVAVGKVTGKGRHEEDCSGLLVTPGWVDMHTHYDGQVTWDPYLTPSGWHGVTTVVMGNCGVGFAPVRREDRDWLIGVMEGVEDIPGSALSEGIDWDWETFPEYLDALERVPLAIDVGTQVPHSAVRAWVMGRRGAENDQATEEDIGKMRALVAEALRAGALGFSTSRTPLHKTATGVLVAGTFASEAELVGIAGALADAGHGVFEVADEHAAVPADLRWMKKLAEVSGQKVVFNLSQVDQSPSLWKTALEGLDEAQEQGIELYAQVAGRAIGILQTFQGTAHPFALTQPWVEMSLLSWEEKRERLKDRDVQRALIEAEPFFVGEFEQFVTRSFDKMFVLGPDNDYEPDASKSVAAIAAREGREPVAVALEILLSDDCAGTLYFPLFNYSAGDLEVLHTMHTHPRTRMGLSDGGAHCGAICDGGMPTFMLTHWTRDRTRGPKMSLPYIVKRQTSETARFYGLHDRGVLNVGYRADINVIDYEGLRLRAPAMVNDLPAGGRRLIQRADGYRMTWCAGELIMRDGEPTGVLPGRVIRGPRPEAVTDSDACL
jgi:N-acyl-D-aspartate/D-glutamate deacylase